MVRGNGQEVEWLDVLVDAVRQLHADILTRSGGLPGEHTARLQAACARPFQSAFGTEAYPDVVNKAAALLHGIVCDHPFVDGNKRTGTAASVLLLASLGSVTRPPWTLQVRFLGELAVETAEGNVTVEQVAYWLRRILELD